jgi:NAD(P)-dependent dehydrogenase (short-subunit alcohol dehydrogenase family)
LRGTAPARRRGAPARRHQPEAIAGLGWKLDDEKIDHAWLVAGVYGPRHDGFPTQQEFDDVMHTNVLAAMRLLPIVGPLVAHARGKLAVISSRMGSIGERTSASGSLYRASKAALNSVLADAALSFGPQGVTCLSFHPGWVQTDMGGAGARSASRKACARCARPWLARTAFAERQLPEPRRHANRW